LLLEEAASVEQIDSVVMDFGRRPSDPYGMKEIAGSTSAPT